jgi:LysM repeat protein
MRSVGGKRVLWAVLCALAWGPGPARAERRPPREPVEELDLASRPFDAIEEVEPEVEAEPEVEREPRREPRRDPESGLTHRVAAGDTLSHIAQRYGLSTQELLERNPGLQADKLRAGQSLVIDANRVRVSYEVAPGDTLSRIADLHGVTIAELQRWNPGLSPDRIRAGRELIIYPTQPVSHSESIGSPSSGQLVRARQLPPGAGYEVRAPERAWGTDETVRGVVAGFAFVRKQLPRAPRLSIHDLSLPHGGRIEEHRSHQSGRDVDIAYPRKRCSDGVCGFAKLAPQDMDTATAWTLLRYWLEHDQLEAVFVDYRLQAPLYREARARGATSEQLSRWFQYPRGRSETLGVIRHYPKHDDHMHVRFGCDPGDLACKSFRPLLMHAASR